MTRQERIDLYDHEWPQRMKYLSLGTKSEINRRANRAISKAMRECKLLEVHLQKTNKLENTSATICVGKPGCEYWKERDFPTM